MYRSKQAGFTIIETMLFLGVSGLLVLGVLIGTGASINIQRYRDSVISLQSLLQQQYNEVANPANDGGTNNLCPITGSSDNKGQSDCVILGKYITSSDGKNILVRSVIGKEPDTFTTISDDVVALSQYNIEVAPGSVSNQTYEVDWGSSIVNISTSNPMPFSLLIVRAPNSGSVRTFISDTSVVSDNSIKTDLLTSEAIGKSVTMCLQPANLLNGTRMAVKINENTTDASGVEMLGDNSGC